MPSKLFDFVGVDEFELNNIEVTTKFSKAAFEDSLERYLQTRVLGENHSTPVPFVFIFCS